MTKKNYKSDINILCHVVIICYRSLGIYTIINKNTSYFDTLFLSLVLITFLGI